MGMGDDGQDSYLLPTAKMGLDPNIWFHNVEVAAAREIGRETVQYVSNIYKYYIAYRMVVDQMQRKNQLLQDNSGVSESSGD